jgi:hypothetical protein
MQNCRNDLPSLPALLMKYAVNENGDYLIHGLYRGPAVGAMIMKKTIGLTLLVGLILACAAVVKTGIVDGNQYTDSQYQLRFEKNDNWRFYIPPEGKSELSACRFSLYRTEHGHKPLQQRTVGGERDPVTGHFRPYRQPGPVETNVQSAVMHFYIDTTELDMEAYLNSLLSRHEDYEKAENIEIGDLGIGCHLLRTVKPYGDVYFVVKNGKAYSIELYAWELNYYRRCKLELEKMLASITH